jgi:hypothetical protein
MKPQKKKSRDYNRLEMTMEETLHLADQYKIMMEYGFKANRKGTTKKNVKLQP